MSERGSKVRVDSTTEGVVNSLAEIANLRYPEGAQARLHSRPSSGREDGVQLAQQVGRLCQRERRHATHDEIKRNIGSL